MAPMINTLASLGVAPHVADRILNHVGGTINGVAAVYQRHQFLAERKEALNVWGSHVARLMLRESSTMTKGWWPDAARRK